MWKNDRVMMQKKKRRRNSKQRQTDREKGRKKVAQRDRQFEKR